MEGGDTGTLVHFLLRGQHLPTCLRSTAFQTLFTKLCHQMIPQAYPASAGWLGGLTLVTEPTAVPSEGRTRCGGKIDVYVPYVRIVPRLGNTIFLKKLWFNFHNKE